MSFIKPVDWQPSSGIYIDGEVLKVVKSDSSISVLAGPGAGKTELLAQKATFLLTTGLCPPPKRILAIAFKVDAARNLRDRVAERGDPMQTRRFESLTLDAFAKRTVDQFLEAIPAQWRPSPDYRIIFTDRGIWEDFRNKNKEKFREMKVKSFREIEAIVCQSFPEEQFDDALSPKQKIRWLWWKQQIDASPSELTFDMIKILAISILKKHPSILSALRHTYSHVFLDEFQDVTALQYQLIQAAFLGSKAILTAVGDSNQAIMRWAGAREDIFEQFEKDFGAEEKRLLFNFRSNRRIVELINDLMKTFDNECMPTECYRKSSVPDNAVERWGFNTRQDEGKYLARFISDELKQNSNLDPSDFLILTRMKAKDVEDRLRRDFEVRNLQIRNESRAVGEILIQDLIKERAYSFFLASSKLATNVRVGNPFQDCQNTIAELRGVDLDSDKGHADTLRDVRNLVKDLEKRIRGRNPVEVSGTELTGLILEHVKQSEFQRTYKEYTGGKYLNSIISGFNEFFDDCRKSANSWSECFSTMEGKGSVHLMTIHKSKGLEYHTVFFVEFNDDAFWESDDNANVFFVALSRARERVYFSLARDSRGFTNVADLNKVLDKADVPFIEK